MPDILPRAALRAGLLAASILAPVAAVAQTTPGATPGAPAAAEPHYRGLVTVPSASGQAGAATPATPDSAPAASAPTTGAPAADPQYRGIVTLPPGGGQSSSGQSSGSQPGAPGTSPSATGTATASPPASPPGGWTTPPPAAPSDTTANAGTPPIQVPLTPAPAQAVTGTPIVRDTATLVIDGRAILIAFIEGVVGAPLSALKDLVTEQGGTVTCLPANAGPYTYTCALADGTDLATIALANGAARLGANAPAAYRAQEANARMNHRGIWASVQESPGHAMPARAGNRVSP